MSYWRNPALTCLCMAVAVPGAWAGGVQAGRWVEEEKRTSVRFFMGKIDSIEGTVDETTRRLFTVTGQDDKQDNAESYSFEDLGLRDSEMMYGLSLEHIWKYVTVQLEGGYVRAEASETANRDFFIGVDDITFNGRKYEYMQLPKGEKFDAELDAGLIAFRAQITPVTFNPGGAIQFVPWIHLGIFAMTGTFEVDAGPAQGVRQYENPPRDYVIGGHGEGDTSVYAPEIGAGGEIKLRLGTRHGQPISLAIQGTYAIFEFSGSNSDLGIASRNDKDLDVEYDTYNVRATLEFPVSARMDLLAGAEYKVVNAEADSEAKDRSLEDTLQRREKFDKHIELEMAFISGFIGVRW
jgi:hypothetical protein